MRLQTLKPEHNKELRNRLLENRDKKDCSLIGCERAGKAIYELKEDILIRLFGFLSPNFLKDNSLDPCAYRDHLITTASLSIINYTGVADSKLSRAIGSIVIDSASIESVRFDYFGEFLNEIENDQYELINTFFKSGFGESLEKLFNSCKLLYELPQEYVKNEPECAFENDKKLFFCADSDQWLDEVDYLTRYSLEIPYSGLVGYAATLEDAVLKATLIALDLDWRAKHTSNSVGSVSIVQGKNAIARCDYSKEPGSKLRVEWLRIPEVDHATLTSLKKEFRKEFLKHPDKHGVRYNKLISALSIYHSLELTVRLNWIIDHTERKLGLWSNLRKSLESDLGL